MPTNAAPNNLPNPHTDVLAALFAPQGSYSALYKRWIYANKFPILHNLPGELRNRIYSHYFPDLPPERAPLATAHHYRPDTALCFADRGLAAESLPLLRPFRQAWNNCTWTVDLDWFLGDLTLDPEDLVRGLTDADAAQIRTLEFSVSAFRLRPVGSEHAGHGYWIVDGVPQLTAPFAFSVSRSSLHRLEIATPLQETWWQRDLVVDGRLRELLGRLHFSLCTKAWWDKSRGRGRHAWTVRELESLLRVLRGVVRDLDARGGGKEVEWGSVTVGLEAEGVWEGRMVEGMRLRDMEALVREKGMPMEEWIWAWDGEGEGYFWLW